jgi:hypothetical protein
MGPLPNQREVDEGQGTVFPPDWPMGDNRDPQGPQTLVCPLLAPGL